MKQKKMDWNRFWRLVCWLVVYAATALVIIMAFAGCASVKDHDSLVEKRHMQSLIQQMDSVLKSQQTFVQDSSWHETFIKELQSIREHNDTSHTVVVDTAGNVVKETIVINNTKEVTNELYQREMEGMRHSMERMDSTIQVQSQQISRTDSLLREKDKQTTITKAVPWYRNLWNNLRCFIIGLIIGVILAMTKDFWLGLLKKLF